MLFCQLLDESILCDLLCIFEAWLLGLGGSCFILDHVNFP